MNITVEALTRGDTDAWTLLQTSYRPLCRIWGARCGLDPDDLWQEAALRLWRALEARKLPNGATVGRWLQLSIKSAALDHARAGLARPACPLPEHDPAAPAMTSQAELADFWALVGEALDELAPLVLRRYVAGESPAALMAEAGMAPNDLYNVLRNGLNRLRRRGPQLLAAYTGEAA